MNKAAILAFCFAVFAGGWVHAGFQAKDWELSLSASGSTPGGGDDFVMGGNVSIGYFLTDNIELSLIQGFGYSDTTEDHWSGSTTGEVDYNLPLNDKWTLFAGGFVTANYGDGVTGNQAGGPDGGVKFFVNPDTTIFGKVMWALPFQDNNNDDGDVIERSTINYQIGVSFKI